jgi:hypothetical protein
MKSRTQHSQPQIKKVDGDVITLSNNIVEQKNGETSTPIFISPIENSCTVIYPFFSVTRAILRGSTSKFGIICVGI